MATANILPVIDSGELLGEDWLTEPLQSPYNSFQCVDNGTYLGGHTPEDSSYLYRSTAGVTGIDFETTPGDVDVVTGITMNIRAKIEDPLSAAHIHLSLFHSYDPMEGSIPVDGNPKTVTGINLGGYGVKGECSVTWTGLSLTKTQIDTLYVEITYSPT